VCGKSYSLTKVAPDALSRAVKLARDAVNVRKSYVTARRPGIAAAVRLLPRGAYRVNSLERPALLRATPATTSDVGH
jgi:hypothetical protein